MKGGKTKWMRKTIEKVRRTYKHIMDGYRLCGLMLFFFLLGMKHIAHVVYGNTFIYELLDIGDLKKLTTFPNWIIDHFT